MTAFGGAAGERDDYDLAVFGIPYDEKSSYLKGAAAGPAAIRAASNADMINPSTELGADLSRDAVLADLGDLDVSGGFGRVSERIGARLDDVLGRGAVPLIMGGDHSITYPIVRSLKGKHPALDILQFDAHPDLYDEFRGDPHSHACPFARILEEDLASTLVQVGIRAATAAHRAKAADSGVRMLEMKDLEDGLALKFRNPLYISFDIDALDPAFAPGVSHLEPGGMTTRQALGIIHGLEADIVGMDVVEVNPSRDPSGITAAAAAKLLMEAAGKIVIERGRS